MGVNESRRDDETIGVNLLAPALVEATDPRYSSTSNRHVAAIGREARTVDNRAVANDKVK